MEPTLHVFLIVLPAVFLAGLVDSIAGGGGLLSVPAYLAAGLPPHFVLGNNKFSSSFGTLFATLRYHQHGMIDVRVALLSAFFALIGSFLGSSAVLLLSPGFLRILLVVLVPLVAVLTLTNRSLGRENHSHRQTRQRKYLLAALAALLLGFYDGFFGPGMGMFLILFFTLALKYDFVTANANTKVVNLASNIAAVVTFIAHGKVIYAIGIPAAVAGIAGNLLGAKLVIRRGSSVIRPVFIFTLLLLFAKILYDLLAGQITLREKHPRHGFQAEPQINSCRVSCQQDAGRRRRRCGRSSPPAPRRSRRPGWSPKRPAAAPGRSPPPRWPWPW